MAKKNGFPGIHFVGRLNEPSIVTLNKDIEELYGKGFDALSIPRLGLTHINKYFIVNVYRQLKCLLKYNGCRHVVEYADEIKNNIVAEYDSKETIYPTIYPNWDHSPRSGKNCLIINGSNPKLFKIYIKRAIDVVKNKQPQHQIIFLKSWNEWGEGNYIEPDIKYGAGYLDVLKEVLFNLSDC